MKKILMIFATLMMVMGLAACGNQESSSKKTTSESSKTQTKSKTNDTKTSDSKTEKGPIPSEFVGNWYQQDTKNVITKDSFTTVNKSNGFTYTLSKDSKPMPLDVYSKDGLEYFSKGTLMGAKGDQWNPKGEQLPYWLATMTIDGKKQTVLANFAKGHIEVLTKTPTTKDYSFELADNVKITGLLPIKDLDKVQKQSDSTTTTSSNGKIPSEFAGDWYIGKNLYFKITNNKIMDAGEPINVKVSKNANGSYKLGSATYAQSINYGFSAGNFWTAQCNVNGKEQNVLAIVYDGDINKGGQIYIEIATSSPTDGEFNIKTNDMSQIGAKDLGTATSSSTTSSTDSSSSQSSNN
ncbi:hypothetical protein ACQW5G_03970 [Fructilactobacillus sp. Tb1]|uniref:hypothetical protein n=1 Tax=Fructilactobacillus sp. Tb1 TaxID=3422304 RepID=UPI003D284F84